MKNRSLEKQNGISVVGWLFVIMLVGGATKIGMDIVPIYMDNNSLKTAIESVAAEKSIGTARKAAVFKKIETHLRRNNVRDFPLEDRLEHKRGNSGAELVVNYEARVDLISNLQLVASFNETYKLGN